MATHRPNLPQAVRLCPAFVWMAVIFALSSQRTLPRPPGLSMTMAGTGGHFVVYAVLAALLYAGLPPNGRTTGRRRFVAVVGAIAFGVTDELHQAFVPGRDPALIDLAVDALGAAVGAGIVGLVAWGRHRR